MVFGLTGTLALLACDRAPRDLSPWSRTLPGTDGESLVAMAIDPQGEPAITGVQADPGSFYPGVPNGGNGGNGLFLAMLSDTGGDLWGGTNHAAGAYGHAVALAPNGDVLLLGSFTSTLELDGHTLTSDGLATFLARFDPRGKLIWSRVLGGSSQGTVVGWSMATSANGDVVIGGALYGEINFGGGFLVGGDAVTSFVARFDENGNDTWSRALRGGNHQVSAVAVDATGAVVAVGSGSGLLGFDISYGMATDRNAFVAKLSPSGEPVFMRALSATYDGGTPTITSVAVDTGGDIFCAGSLIGAFTFGPIAVDKSLSDPFVARLSSAGEPRWLDHFGGAQGGANAVVVGQDAKVYVTGYYLGAHLDAGAIQLGSANETTMFLAELDQAGAVTGARTFGDGTTKSTGRALVVDPQGALLIGGSFRGSLDFDDQTLNSAPTGSSFVARLALPFASHRRE
jgi:hypothetical protein